MLRDKLQSVLNEFHKIKKPRANVTKIVHQLTKHFNDRINHHTSEINNETNDEAREALIADAINELNNIIDRLAAEIRDHPPSVCRCLKF